MRMLLLIFSLTVAVIAAEMDAPVLVNLGPKSNGVGTSWQIALNACVGLANLNSPSSVYSLGTSDVSLDYIWLSELDGFVPAKEDTSIFFKTCFADYAKGYVLYDYATQKALIPNVLTYAAVAGAIPINKAVVDDFELGDMELVQDLTHYPQRGGWRGMGALEVTEKMWEEYKGDTTGLCMMNPGYQFNNGTVLHPPLNNDPDPNLVDFIFSRRLFTMYLPNQCNPAFPRQHAVMSTIATENEWPKPIPVYGYDDTDPVLGGDMFEAETNCVEEGNMGQVATKGVNNLAYWGGKVEEDGDLQLQQNDEKDLVYDPNKTYVALVVGDGDNINMLKGRNYVWWQARRRRCAEKGVADDLRCFPLVWTISSQLVELHPRLLQYYYEGAKETGKDYFILPPSGSLYSYPSMMSDSVQEEYARTIVSDFAALDTRCSVHWEWFYSWGGEKGALATYFPRFSAVAGPGDALGFFLTNVPYPIPIEQFDSSEDFKIIAPSPDSRALVLFKPHVWRGTDTSNAERVLDPAYSSPARMADKINGLPPGSVTHIYLTSDGGATIDSVYNLVVELGEEVMIVSAGQLVDIALQKAGV
mmetsp:Transcript_5194/g.9958  ORF Transcript_5194/g.9958 Transcript_5194/m.9958 type:complete len:586 (+) Transcript_5194:118-1875(+)